MILAPWRLHGLALGLAPGQTLVQTPSLAPSLTLRHGPGREAPGEVPGKAKSRIPGLTLLVRVLEQALLMTQSQW